MCALVFIICTHSSKRISENEACGRVCVQAPGKEKGKRLRACVTYVFVYPCVRWFGDKRSAQKGFRCNVHLSVSVHRFLCFIAEANVLVLLVCQLLMTTSPKLSAAIADCSVRNIRIVLIPEDATFFCNIQYPFSWVTLLTTL